MRIRCLLQLPAPSIPTPRVIKRSKKELRPALFPKHENKAAHEVLRAGTVKEDLISQPMRRGIQKSFKIFAPGSSLQKRVAYSLAIVRLILVPVIFLAVYYLFAMGRIVDRIVNVDAPAAKLAERASIEMLEARRTARDYALLHDPEYFRTNRRSLASVRQDLARIGELELDDHSIVQQALRHGYLVSAAIRCRGSDDGGIKARTHRPHSRSSDGI